MPNNANQAEIEAGDQDSEDPNQFQGGSYIDGVRQPDPDKPADKAAAKDAKTAAANAAAAKVAGKDPADKGGKSSAQGRINELTREARTAQRERDDARRELAALRAGGSTPAAAAATVTALKEPDPKDYEGGEIDVRYIKDLARYEAKKEAAASVAASRAEGQSAATNAANAAAVERFNSDRAELFEKGNDLFDDFEEVVTSAPALSEYVSFLAFGSEFGPQIIYDLAGDNKLQRQVWAMSPAEQSKWFGKQEAKLELSSEQDATDQTEKVVKAPKNATKAPAAPGETARGSGGTTRTDASTGDFAAFERSVMQGVGVRK